MSIMNTLLYNKYITPAIGITIIVFSYFDTFLSLIYTLLNDPTPYIHGIAILPLSVFLIIYTFHQYRTSIEININKYGILLLFVSSLGWLLSVILLIEILEHLFFILIFIALFSSIYQYKIAKLFFTPILLIVLGLPIWNVFVLPLQNATVNSTLFLLQLFGITSVAEGVYIVIPEGTFKIAALCSGMRYQAASIIIVLFYSHINKLSFKRTSLYLLLISALAFISNQLRVFAVIVSGHLTDMQHYFVKEDHVSLGWVIFAIAMFLFFYFATNYENEASTNKHNNNSNISDPNISFINYLLFIMLLISIISVPMLKHNFVHDSLVIETKTNHINRLADWRLIDTNFDDRKPIWTNGNDVYTGVYSRNSDEPVYVYVSHFDYQVEGTEAISVVNKTFDPLQWELISSEKHTVFLEERYPLNINETVVSEHIRIKEKSIETAERRLIWLWYQIGERTETNAYFAKLWNLLEIMQGNPAITVYIVSTDLDAGVDQARKRLKHISASLISKLKQ